MTITDGEPELAVLHEQRKAGIHYQVRSAGHAKRLYTNGVFHSQWNPRRPIAGAVWDLLSLPALYLPQARHQPLRFLLLGVGGGAVLRQLQLLVPHARFTGVELDPVHLRLARDYFGLSELHAELHCADAVEWVRNYRGPRFDCVIDDLFSHQNGEPERAVKMDSAWAGALRRLTHKSGLLVANFASSQQLRESALLRQSYPCVYQWAQPGYDNAVGACVRGSGDARYWRLALLEHPELSAAAKRAALASRRTKLV
ncbi:MAG: spermidine synthase [Granulosicoccaceae bacterium]